MKNSWFPLFLTCLLLVQHQMVSGYCRDQKAYLFDSYGWVISEDAAARLDNFAIELQKHADTVGYIIIYGPEGAGSGTGGHMLRVTKDYLINTRGFKTERVQTVYGGSYKEPFQVSTELWIVPPGASPPLPKHYKSRLERVTGKVAEYKRWDGTYDGADGPQLGNVTLASFAAVLRHQPRARAYIVGYNLRGAAPGTWRRVAKLESSDLQGYGVEASRISVVYGGDVKSEVSAFGQEALVELWVLPPNAPSPIKGAPPEPIPKKAVQLGYYNGYILKYPDEERRFLEGVADVLQADRQLSVCIIIRPRLGGEVQKLGPDGPPDIDMMKLAGQWKARLLEKADVRENRVVIIHASPDEVNEGTLEVWVLPPGAALPDPYDSPNGES